jgi:hypothetical protein
MALDERTRTHNEQQQTPQSKKKRGEDSGPWIADLGP